MGKNKQTNKYMMVSGTEEWQKTCYKLKSLSKPSTLEFFFFFLKFPCVPLLGFCFFPFIFISWRLITLQYCSGFCHTLTWISHGFTCVPHPYPPSCLLPHPIPLGLPSAPALSTCLMHPTWAGDQYCILMHI